jgi:hypothetical protein
VIFLYFFLRFLIIYQIINYSADSSVGKEFGRLSPIAEVERIAKSKEIYFNRVSLDGRKITFDTKDIDFSLILNDENRIRVVDETGTSMLLTSYEDYFMVGDKRLEGVKFDASLDNKLFTLKIANKKLQLSLSDAGFGLYELDGSYSTPVYPNYFGPRGYEKFASSRGYIWQTTIPLLKKTIILGTGPGTYIYTFPQRDITGKLNAFSDSTKIIDKPHNMYLQMAVNTGIISLIAFLVLLFLYIGNALKYILRTKPDNEYRLISIGILTGILGYLVAGMFNDSIVSVAPVFWTLLGIGIVINYKLKEKAIN